VSEHADWIQAATHANLKLAEFVRTCVRKSISLETLENFKKKQPNRLEDL
jgi:hypothetical protein